MPKADAHEMDRSATFQVARVPGERHEGEGNAVRDPVYPRFWLNRL